MRSSLLKNKSELKRWAGLLFVLPAFIYHFIVVIVPSIKTLYLSFFDWNGIGNPTFIGLDNFIEMFTADEVCFRSH